MEKQELNKRNSLIVASHQWLLGELAQILELVAGFRHKLCECAPSRSGADIDSAQAPHDYDVDAGLQQIEHLLSALVRLDPDDITDVDIYGCDDTQHDRLASAAGRLMRDNHSLDLQLRQAIRENSDLQLTVDRLECDAGRLNDHNVTLQGELGRLRAANDNFRAELSEFLPESESVDMNSVVKAFGEMKKKAQELQTISTTLQAKVVQIEDSSVSKNTELQTKIEQLQAEREALLRRKNELQQQERQYSYSTDSGSGTLAGPDGRLDSVAEEVADIFTRLQDQNAVLEKAVEMRDVLCGDLDQVKMDNDRLLGVVGELRTELDNKDSGIVRLRANITDLEERLVSERHEFCQAVELVRRENATECDKIAKENHHLTTLLQELELPYTVNSERSKITSSNDERLFKTKSEHRSDCFMAADNIVDSESRVFASDKTDDEFAANKVDRYAYPTLVLSQQRLRECNIAEKVTTATVAEDSGSTLECTLLENIGLRTNSSTQCDEELLANISAVINALQRKVSLLESRNDELTTALDAERQRAQFTEYQSMTSSSHAEKMAIDAELSPYSETQTNDSELKTKITAKTNVKMSSSANREYFVINRSADVGQPKSEQTVEVSEKEVNDENDCHKELLVGELQKERRTSQQLCQELTCFNEFVDKLTAKLASNEQMMQQLRDENNELRQKLRRQLSVEMCRMKIGDVDFDKLDATSDSSDKCGRASALSDVDYGGDVVATAARSAVDNTSEVLRRYGELTGENQALRQRIGEAWNVSVQHAISRNVAVQTTETSRTCFRGRSERDIYSLWVNNQTLSAQLLAVLVCAIDAMRRRSADGCTPDDWHSGLRCVTSSEIQRKKSSTVALEQHLQRCPDNNDEEDESGEWISEPKRCLQNDNDALRDVLSALNELQDTSVLQQHDDVSHHGDDTNVLSSAALRLEVSRLQQQMLVKLQ